MNLKLVPSLSAPVRLAILECDTPLPETKEQYKGYGGVFQALLRASAKAEGYNPDEILQISTWQVELEPEKYPAVTEIDAVLITGSRHDAFADSHWINKLVEYVTQLLTTTSVRVIGVCFGHQIIGRALKGEVGRNPRGWEAAVNKVELSAKGQQLFGGVSNVYLHQMHRDAVLSVPSSEPDVEVLGSSPICPIQILYQTGRLLGVQGHPEFDEPIMREIIETRHAAGVFDDKALQEHMGKVALKHDGLVVGAAFVRFLVEGR